MLLPIFLSSISMISLYDDFLRRVCACYINCEPLFQNIAVKRRNMDILDLCGMAYKSASKPVLRYVLLCVFACVCIVVPLFGRRD